MGKQKDDDQKLIVDAPKNPRASVLPRGLLKLLFWSVGVLSRLPGARAYPIDELYCSGGPFDQVANSLVCAEESTNHAPFSFEGFVAPISSALTALFNQSVSCHTSDHHVKPTGPYVATGDSCQGIITCGASAYNDSAFWSSAVNTALDTIGDEKCGYSSLIIILGTLACLSGVLVVCSILMVSGLLIYSRLRPSVGRDEDAADVREPLLAASDSDLDAVEAGNGAYANLIESDVEAGKFIELKSVELESEEERFFPKDITEIFPKGVSLGSFNPLMQRYLLSFSGKEKNEYLLSKLTEERRQKFDRSMQENGNCCPIKLIIPNIPVKYGTTTYDLEGVLELYNASAKKGEFTDPITRESCKLEYLNSAPDVQETIVNALQVAKAETAELSEQSSHIDLTL